MRQDVVELSDRVLTSGRKLWVLVNNKAEGSSPLSIMELAKRVAETQKAATTNLKRFVVRCRCAGNVVPRSRSSVNR